MGEIKYEFTCSHDPCVCDKALSGTYRINPHAGEDWQDFRGVIQIMLRDGGLVAIEPDYGAAKTLLREKLGYFDFEDPPTEDAVIEWLPDLINAALTKEDQ